MCEHGDDMLDAIIGRRTVRKFQGKAIPADILDRIVEAGRLAPSAGNVQPLEFIVVDDPGKTKEVFPLLKWAAYISPEGDPKNGEEPAAYIAVLVNTRLREKFFEYDVGAAAENMILAGLSFGIAGCWMYSIDREKLAVRLGVPEHYRIDCVLSLGYPAEEPTVEPMDDSPRYWKDEKGRLHVPKRAANDVVHHNRF